MLSDTRIEVFKFTSIRHIYNVKYVVNKIIIIVTKIKRANAAMEGIQV